MKHILTDKYWYELEYPLVQKWLESTRGKEEFWYWAEERYLEASVVRDSAGGVSIWLEWFKRRVWRNSECTALDEWLVEMPVYQRYASEAK